VTHDAEKERRQGERRHTVERRTPQGRRTALNRRARERRSLRLKIARQDRRRALNRRITDRRRKLDRRTTAIRRLSRRLRTAPSPYTVQQIVEIKSEFAKPNSRSTCPACGGTFTLSRGRNRGDAMLRRVQCLRCGKSVVVTDSWKIRVLVIAEKAIIRDSIRETLNEVGHEVVDAADASVALWAYQQNPADVVFIDVLVAGYMNASEFIRQIRKYSPDAHVVAVSGRASYGGRDPLLLARKLGAVQTIRAPFSQAQLLEVLQPALPK
jgi:CheY-like chemotaxis protein